MIRDARVLQPEFVPREVRHRDGEVDALEAALAPITREEPAEIPFCFGPSGTGKTCLSRYIVEQLAAERPDLEYKYVNCWEAYSPFRALYEILDGIDQAIDVHRQSTPQDELLDRVRQYDASPYVVILDEVDQLEDKDLLYALYKNPKITMILIATREEDLFANLDHRLASRLHGAQHVRFRPYGEDELVTILEDRAQWGLEPEAITTEQLATIADAAAGDARFAISILRNAARHAQRDGREAITDAILNEAIPAGRVDVRQTNLETLKPTQQTLYEIVKEHEEIGPQELYEAYEERADPEHQVGERQVRRHLNTLADYDLVVVQGSTRARTYRIVEPAP